MIEGHAARARRCSDGFALQQMPQQQWQLAVCLQERCTDAAQAANTIAAESNQQALNREELCCITGHINTAADAPAAVPVGVACK
jgi:hypothetical protein